MNKIIIILVLMASTLAFSQVGIGTQTPSSKSILDLTATDKGFLLPRMTTSQRTLIAPTATTDKSMQVFDTDTNSIWFWNGTIWVEQGNKLTGSSTIAINGSSIERQALTGEVTAPANSNATTITNGVVTTAKIADGAVNSAKIADNEIVNADLSNVATGVGGIYKGSGSLSSATTVTQGANTLAFTSTATNGFSVDGTTLSVDASNNNVGIGTTAPNTKAILDLTASDKGFLMPRVALTSKTSPAPLGAPIPVGLLVMNTATNTMSGQELNPNQLYKWSGTQWDELVDLAKVTDLVSQALGTLNVPTQVLSANVSGTQIKAGGSGNMVVAFPNELTDFDNAFNGTVYTAPENGTYTITSQLSNVRTVGNFWYFTFQIDVSTNAGISWNPLISDTRSMGSGDLNNSGFVYWSGNLNAGNQIRLIYASSSSTNNIIQQGTLAVTKL